MYKYPVIKNKINIILYFLQKYTCTSIENFELKWLCYVVKIYKILPWLNSLHFLCQTSLQAVK